MPPRISAVICTYNRYDVLVKALESLKRQTLPRNQYQIIVVDNSPDHRLAEEMKEKYESLPLIKYLVEKTPGLSNARNVASRICGTKYIAYLDDDAIASPGWLDNILKGFDLFGDEAEILGGRVDPLWEIERPSWLDDSLLGYVSVVDWGGELRIAKESEWFAGANISFKTQAILRNDGFDTNLGRKGSGSVLLSNEEISLLNKIKEQGGLNIYAPNASVKHLVERKRINRNWFRQRVAWQAVSEYVMNSQNAVKMALSGWDSSMEYFFSLPPRERTIKGLYYDTDDPNEFRSQLSTLYNISTMLLAGFQGVK